MVIIVLSQLNLVQSKSYALIKSDARFFYSIMTNPKKPKSNHITMLLPYLGVFADGAEQWGRKAKVNTPTFSADEKKYYIALRESAKIFNLGFNEFCDVLYESFQKSEAHFSKICNPLRKHLKLYNNVGCDLQKDSFLGNTILCSVFSPFFEFDNSQYGEYVRKTTIVAGKLSAVFDCKSQLQYSLSQSLTFRFEDYHFFARCPLKSHNFIDFCLFSILCNINLIRIFVEQYFLEEFSSKLRFAYLQYYYLTKLIPEINQKLALNFSIDSKFKDDKFRNCIAHYGLGVVMKESDIVENDLMFGLTNKIFGVSYIETKSTILDELNKLANQLEVHLF